MSAPRHMRREDDVDLDYSERAGFLTGKAAAMADWSFRKEARAFKAVVNRLRVAKWQRANVDRKRANARKYARKPEVKAAYNEAARARRAAKPSEVIVCAECSQQFSRARKGPRPKFCGDACRQRAAYQAKTPGARRIKRHKESA